ncbi:MAG: hypothetical protein JWM12_1142 [Ilumatobacteraceae bacterium]|nr:hypothetical protein [Ilumatobacteraceae bacterium]
MPTYVYKFLDTGETIEVPQAFTDDPLTEAVHPSSGKTMKVKKVFTPVGVSFKGGGFYKTDSRGKSSSAKPAGAAAGAGESSGSSGGSEGSSSSSSDGSSSSSKPSSDSSSSSGSSSGAGSATPAAKPTPTASSSPASS